MKMNICKVHRTSFVFLRNMAWIFERRYPPRAPEKGQKLKLKPENFVYDVLECTHENERPPIEAIFIKDVPGYAYGGEVRFVDREKFRREFIPQKVAVYSTDFNKNWFQTDKNYCNGVFLRDNVYTSNALDAENFLKNVALEIKAEFSKSRDVKITSKHVAYVLKTKLKFHCLPKNLTLLGLGGQNHFSAPGEYKCQLKLNDVVDIVFKVIVVNCGGPEPEEAEIVGEPVTEFNLF